MVLDRTNNSFRNVFFGYINKFLGLICPFLIRTFMVRYLGAEYLGLNSLFASLLQVLNLAELGFSSAVVFSMYKPVAENNDVTICALLQLYKRIYQIVGVVISVLGVMLLPFLECFINGGYPDINIHLVYVLYLFNTVLSYELSAYKTCLLEAYQRTDIESKIASLINSMMYVCQIFGIILFKDYYVYMVLMPIFTIITNLVRSFIVTKMFPEYIPKGRISSEIKAEISAKVKALIVYKIGNIVSNAVDNIIISSFLGLSLLAIYNNYYYIISALFGFLMIYYNAVKAGIGNSIVLDSVEKNEEDFNCFYFAQAWIVGWASICLVCLFQNFMVIWMGKEQLLPFYMVLLLAVYFYVWKIHDIVHTYKDALGMWEEDKWRPLISSGVNLIGNLFLVNKFGLPGIVISTIIAEIVVTMPWAPPILYRNYFDKSCKIYYFSLIRYTVITSIIGCITLFVCTRVSDSNIWTLLFKMMMCVIVPNALYYIVYKNDNNLARIKEVLSKRISKK